MSQLQLNISRWRARRCCAATETCAGCTPMTQRGTLSSKVPKPTSGVARGRTGAGSRKKKGGGRKKGYRISVTVESPARASIWYSFLHQQSPATGTVGRQCGDSVIRELPRERWTELLWLSMQQRESRKPRDCFGDKKKMQDSSR